MTGGEKDVFLGFLLVNRGVICPPGEEKGLAAAFKLKRGSVFSPLVRLH